MTFFIGIDGGGTKTEALLINEHGQVLGNVRGGATNPASAGGVDQALERLIALVRDLLEQSAITPNQQFTMFAGISGMGAPHLRQKGIETLQKSFPTATIGWDHDGVNALFSGTFGGVGGVLIAGTGSVAYGMDSSGNRIRIGGWGHWLGDEGSGFSLGLRTLRKIMEAWDGRGPQTILTEKILNHWKLKHPEDLVAVVQGNDVKQRVASIVPLVLEAAGEADEMALQAIAETGREQGELIAALAERLLANSHIEIVSIVLTGGLFQQPNWFFPVIERELSTLREHIKFIFPKVAPVVGALAAALKLAAVPEERIKELCLRTIREEKR
jgi:N-acetylglucosamine kinase-like BadF-type ATPase